MSDPRCDHAGTAGTRCHREATAWCAVDGAPARLCDLHRGHATRSGAWVVTDWNAPVDGPAPRFDARPSTVDPKVDAWALAPEPAPIPKADKHAGRPPTPTRLTDPNHDPALCLNATCRVGKPPRNAEKRGLCGPCAQLARNRGVYEKVANAPKSIRPQATAKLLTPRRNPTAADGMCVNATCPGGGATPARCRGLCDPCGRLARVRGVYESVALPANPGTRTTPRKVTEAELAAVRAVAVRVLGADAVEGLTTLGAVEAMAVLLARGAA